MPFLKDRRCLSLLCGKSRQADMRFVAAAAVVSFFICGFFAAAAEPAQPRSDAAKALALLEKLSPGMTYEETIPLLAEAADTHNVKGGEDLVRRYWLHGDFGVEIYFLEEKAWRITVISQLMSENAAKRAVAELSRSGRNKYGENAGYDRQKSEYFWVSGGMKLSFSRLGTEVRVSRQRY